MRRVALLIVTLGVMMPASPAARGKHGQGQNFVHFRNNGRGKFAERTTSHFVPPDDPTTDSAFGDIDGDADLDLVVGNSGANGVERVFVQYPCAHGLCDFRSE